MSKPVVITVAITGALPRKKDTPAVPVTPAEQIESTHEAFEAGASLVHVHVRSPDESPSSDPELFAQVQEGVRKHCPGMIIQFSTGGRGRDQAARASMLHLKPDMASLATGSNNFPTRVYENPPDLVDWLAAEMLAHEIKPEIECFDLSHIHQAAAMQADGRLKAEFRLWDIYSGKQLAGEQFFSQFVEAGFRITHRCRTVAVDRAVVSLHVD